MLQTLNRRCLVLTLAASCMVGAACQAFDTIKTAKGTLYGEVVGMDSTKVDFRQVLRRLARQTDTRQRNRDRFLRREPSDLRMAKNHALGGRYAEALAALKKIEKTPDRQEMQQDIEFYKALCAAKLAMAGSMKIADAGRMMKAFADANPKSYHYFEASEVVGDLLVAIGSYASGGGILRPARGRPLARLSDAGGRGRRPGACSLKAKPRRP